METHSSILAWIIPWTEEPGIRIAVHRVLKSETQLNPLSLSSITQSCPTETPRTGACQLPCPSPIPRACSNSCPSSRWCRLTISSSVISFPSCVQYFPESGSFLRSQYFASGGQNIGASASASALLMNIQGWFPLGLSGWISFHSKGLSRLFSNTTVQKHQCYSAQPSIKSNTDIHAWLPEKC